MAEFTSTTLRIPSNLWDIVKTRAEREGTSANAIVVSIVHDHFHGSDPVVEEMRLQISDLQTRLIDLQQRLMKLEGH